MKTVSIQLLLASILHSEAFVPHSNRNNVPLTSTANLKTKAIPRMSGLARKRTRARTFIAIKSQEDETNGEGETTNGSSRTGVSIENGGMVSNNIPEQEQEKQGGIDMDKDNDIYVAERGVTGTNEEEGQTTYIDDNKLSIDDFIVSTTTTKEDLLASTSPSLRMEENSINITEYINGDNVISSKVNSSKYFDTSPPLSFSKYLTMQVYHHRRLKL